jgi:ubiquinone biosynthesis monooxygenase Coq7
MLADRLIGEFDRFLRTVAHVSSSARPLPVSAKSDPEVHGGSDNPKDRQTAGRLMRVNHVGEVCAQALYRGHGAATARPDLQDFFAKAASEEQDHLVWTKARLDALDAHPSFLNPLWYAASFALGYASGKMSDEVSLGLMAETERQVEAHLEDHLQRLPVSDRASAEVLRVMRDDEAAHASAAESLGAATLPLPAKLAMRLGAKVMTGVAYYV